MVVTKSKVINSKFLLAVLNSKVVQFYWVNKFRDNRKTFPKIKGEYLKLIPVPQAPPELQAPIVKLVDQILTAKRADPDADISALERKIDQLVYKLYNLTPEEIAIVEGKANQPKDEPQEVKEKAEKFYKVRITKEQAAQGVRVAIPTGDDKKITIRLPAGVSDGKQFRIKEHNLLLIASVER